MRTIGNRIGWKAMAAAALCCGCLSNLSRAATITTVADFEAPANNAAEYLFRNPSNSSTTLANLATAGTPAVTTPNVQKVTDTFPAGLASAGLHVGTAQFQFTDSAVTRWVRHTTINSTGKPNPALDYNQLFEFDVYSTVDIRVAALVREVTTNNGPIGANGGTIGSIEYVGGKPGDANNANAGKLVPANTWTTLVYNFATEPAFAFTGNGVVNPQNTQWLVLEALGITSTGNAGPITVYYDNFRQEPTPEPGTGLLIGAGLVLLAKRGRARRA